MVPTDRAVLQFFILILCTINGLHSYPRNHPSLGILNELIGTDSKSPLIVVVDSNNQARTLDDEPDQGYGEGGPSHSKSCPNHPDYDRSPSHNNDNRSPKLSNQHFEHALYELLRTSQKMMEIHGRQGSSNKGKKDSCEANGGKHENNEKKGKNGGKKDSCEAKETNNPQEFLAEQCSQSGDSCGNFDDDKDTC